ncbi:MAG: hypothetical protein CVU07_01295 [Bacteroidetes bacterium HGW-Bacteroidetes-23]|nr:MAG: hypothetical protein CVU07_01295 [Bacteroidetes bacterium HGW-Bacteroidetes-23]
MEEVKIFYKPDVELFLNELIFILYRENYFTFFENAIDYKDKIVDFIEQNIANIPFKNTPLPLYSLGSKYIFYNSNSRTTWYIFFEKEENQFLITYISNNHKDIARFIKY